MRTLDLVTEKWGGRPHRRGEVVHLGDDEHGTWLWGREGREIVVADQRSFRTRQDAVILVPPGAWWMPSWWLGHPTIGLYVDVVTPAVVAEDRITAVDLDLDVARFLDGRVELLDRDEFEEHRVEYGYPAEVAATAEAAAAEVLGLVEAGTAPFDGAAAARWATTIG